MQTSAVYAQPWPYYIKPGQKLKPIALWNQTERWPNQLTSPTEILDVIRTTCQTGISFKVQPNEGPPQWLDAAWFENPNIT